MPVVLIHRGQNAQPRFHQIGNDGIGSALLFHSAFAVRFVVFFEAQFTQQDQILKMHKVDCI